MTAAGKPIWPKIPSGFVRAVLAGHSALGLAFAALIYLVCLSGSAAVFIQEIQRWERPQDPVVAKASPTAIQTAFREGLRLSPDTDRVVLNLPGGGLPRFAVSTWHGKTFETWALDADGRVAQRQQMPFTDFVQDLHIYLHLPRSWGIFVVGLTGVALLSSLVSGVLAHPRVFRDAFHLRWGGSKRLQEADLHNRIGVWALPFHVTLSLTGALLGLSTVIVGVLAMVVFKGDTEKAYALFATPEPAHDVRAAPAPDLTAMLATLARVAPAATPTYVVVEDPRQTQQHISFGTQTSGRLSRETYSFDHTGALLGGTGYGARNLGERLYGAVGPAHFGWYGGLTSKLVYGLLGLGLTTVTSSGVAIWLARRRAKGRPAPAWERIWIATVWSQPFALALAALAALLTAWPPVAVWGAGTIAALPSAAFLAPARISAALRLAAGALLVATAATHVAIWHSHSVDPVVWAVDLALFILALTLTPLQAIGLGRRAEAPASDEPDRSTRQTRRRHRAA